VQIPELLTQRKLVSVAILGLGMQIPAQRKFVSAGTQIPEIPAQRKFVSVEVHAYF